MADAPLHPDPASEAEAAAHRRMAMASNTRAWDLSVREAARTPGEDLEMLDAAHASAWHWGQVGTELNRMRATMLLAEVHALLEDGPRALAYAREMRAYFLGRESPDWEIAFTHAVTAHAAAKAGDRELHRAAHASAQTAIAAIADEEERGIVAKTFAHVPPP
jgi:hypothetical protein